MLTPQLAIQTRTTHIGSSPRTPTSRLASPRPLPPHAPACTAPHRSDPAAGPNPGLAASDPAAQQPLTAEQIEAVFVGLVDDDDDAEMHAEDDGGDEGEEEQDEEEHRQGEGAQAPEGASTSSSSSSPEGSDLGDDGEEDPGAEEKGAAAMADSDAEGGQPASADAHNMVTD